MEYRIFGAHLIRSPIFLLIFYWLAMISVGFLLLPYSKAYVRNYNESLVSEVFFIYLIGFTFFLLGVLWWSIVKYTAGWEKKFGTDWGGELDGKITIHYHRVFIIVLACSFVLLYTFYSVGYIPLTHDHPGAKYFQDRLEAYIPLRPFYTLSISVLSSLLVVLLIAFYSNRKLLLAIVVVVVSIILLMTEKRGPLLLPFAYLILGLFLSKRMSMLGAILVFLGLIFAALGMYSIAGYGAIKGSLIGFVNSFMVGPRELVRLMTIFDDKYLHGWTYLASLISFIPTEYSDIKSTYIFTRYIMVLDGANPDLSGGMRASYLGEAFINFGYIGVITVSLAFGIIASASLNLLCQSRIVIGMGLAGYVLVAQVIHQGMLAFFENGSPFILHFIIRTVMFVLLYKFCVSHSKEA